MNKNTDVVVMGAGVIGCAVAYYLAKKGCRVIVIEKKERVCAEASGANLGGVPLTLLEPSSPTLEMHKETLKLFDNLSEETGYDMEFQRVGLLTCTLDEGQHSAMEKLAQGFQQKGIDVKLIEGDEIRKCEPGLSDKITVGIEEEETGILNPFKTTHGLARAARNLGAEFLLATETRTIEVDKDKITAVVTDKGRIGTEFVVNAAGAWTPEIGKMVGLNIPIEPIKGQAMVTEPVAPNQRWRYIMDAAYINHGAAPNENSEDIDMRLGITGGWIQENTGGWTIGSSHEANSSKAATMPTASCLARKAIEFMPRLKGVHCIRAWANLRPYCYVDDLPIISKVDSPSGFVIATGHLGAGVTLAPITGKLIAELIIDNKTSLPIDAFSFSRFNNQA